jgi:hypothetical protein
MDALWGAFLHAFLDAFLALIMGLSLCGVFGFFGLAILSKFQCTHDMLERFFSKDKNDVDHGNSLGAGTEKVQSWSDEKQSNGMV